ncbi:MAG: hypothetical protein OXN89_09395 [Bryobacterales bacterium]|nr:hypothetical protein [Bryobacterales bacterium]
MNDGVQISQLLKHMQEQVTDSAVPLSDVLRRAAILASRLEDERFSIWVNAELQGYGPSDDLPDYRRFRAENVGTFMTRFRKSTGIQIPITALPENIRKMVEYVDFRQAVRELDSYASQDSADGAFCSFWPAELVMQARKYLPMEDGSVLIEARQQYSGGKIVGIVDQIRNRLLNFLLELDSAKSEIWPDGLNGERGSQEIVGMIVTNKIYGSNNIVASGHHVSQVVVQRIDPDDSQSLIQYFRDLGLDESLVSQLGRALHEDGERPQGQFGPLVKSWMVEVLLSATQQALGWAKENAWGIVHKALSKYYGWE